ncbi:MAG: 50S ribosomal protein L11 methyltransferase [Candidatus Latescibacteria bacterium]|nr:50S ribosomal protein L11 methyltransferase [Candidatus Latescibacterota bacterium]
MITEWVEITVPVTQETEEAVSNMLCELGSNGVVTDAGTGLRNNVSGYIPAGERIQDKLHRLRTLWDEMCKLGLATGTCDPIVRSVPISDWTSWQANFKPVRVTGKIVITPPWASVAERVGQIVVEIVPGLAFGTGEHETTQLCLRGLERNLKTGDRLLDTGTGSGILAIAAVKLGADCVVALEIDDMALESARENVERNKVADSIGLYEGSINHTSVTGTFNVIVSNTESRTIRSLLSGFHALLKRDGVLILSGILREESAAVAAEVAAQGFAIFEDLADGEWWSCTARPC